MPPLKPVGPGVEAIEEVKRQLKENQSQRTEVTGHINQLNIQLHRWQHRLNMLNQRQRELETQIGINPKRSENSDQQKQI